MNALLEQFIAEAREFLQAISVSLMALEEAPDDVDRMTELFRQVHTLKGNSGLFEFPAMTRVLHAAEDLMDVVRHGQLPFSLQLTDVLLDSMDFVAQLLDEVERNERIDASRDHEAVTLAASLRAMLPAEAQAVAESAVAATVAVEAAEASPLAFLRAIVPALQAQLLTVSESLRMELFAAAQAGGELTWVQYEPEPECFFKGEDPFFLALQTPGFSVAGVHVRSPWPALAELDAYRCELRFGGISQASRAELDEHFRYVPEQVRLLPLPALLMVLPSGDENGGPVYEDFVVEALALLDRGDLAGLRRAARSLLEFSSPTLWLSSALRWLLRLLEVVPQQSQALRALIQCVQTLNAPDWLQYLDAAPPAAVAVLPVEPAVEPAEPAVELVQAAAPSACEPVPALAEPAQAEPVAPVAPVAPAAVPVLGEVRLKALGSLLQAQGQVLTLPVDVRFIGRMRAVMSTLSGCARTLGLPERLSTLQAALEQACAQQSPAPMQAWLADFSERFLLPAQAAAEAATQAAMQVPAPVPNVPAPAESESTGPSAASAAALFEPAPVVTAAVDVTPAATEPTEAVKLAEPVALDTAPRGARRSEEHSAAKTLRVDQVKIDRLMNLIGEMVVAKNALPYLATRAENQYGVRELAREIKGQYGVINRIAEEMQDAIMQVRMMPVSFVFQRFPRLVRDLSNKLGKEVALVLEGEETEADKNVIEALADPLIHIVRNSLDHGLELPAVRRASGKPEKGRLQITARQAADHVTIEIVDDGKGIDPLTVKTKAYEKGLIDEERMEQLTDQEAVNLVFLPGFSTVDAVTDLSGRGVGMDVVRSAIDKVGGTVRLSSVLGQGTSLRLSLPLSMAITNVMIIESARQIFGFPMDAVVETVRLPRSRIRYFKQHATTVLREKVIPLFSLNTLLALDTEQLANDQDELALLVLRLGQEQVGLLVDAFRETTDIILKPLPGVLGDLRGYAGSALLGDGSVLMVLDHKELF
ncbi:chemotaxis protein CheA [Malikia sp.]|uniref:chemotaxis protein CheA n=1 Tax=Malikia sp. TaxID=2070706 RepID=UPI00261A8414|nr:chemotaxis protein CheA [Malikia sp.]MDD2727918.1 chemotaxis protein CheW [Malikia sp.]